MEKLVNINLGGYAFMMTEDAYLLLRKYLNAVEKKYKNSDGYKEITEDIEGRIAELIQEKKSSYVKKTDVNDVISIMGRPEAFDDADNKSTKEGMEIPLSGTKTGKKLFRDIENKKVAGVCAGLAAYFGVKDALIFRILFVVFSFSGISLFVYALLWAIVPAAKSSVEKLAMKGEDINLSNIAESIEDKFDTLNDKLSQLGKEWNT